MSGRLIVFEGADASGKSTQARRLAERLGADLTFQFGATAIGAAIRSILLDPAHSELDDRAEALLVIADKAQHVAEIVGPALERGETVVSDRFTASTSAYQGYGRGLDLAGLDAMMRFATHGLEPDLTVLLDVPWSVARSGWAKRWIELRGREPTSIPGSGMAISPWRGRPRSLGCGRRCRRHRRRDRCACRCCG